MKLYFTLTIFIYVIIKENIDRLVKKTEPQKSVMDLSRAGAMLAQIQPRMPGADRGSIAASGPGSPGLPNHHVSEALGTHRPQRWPRQLRGVPPTGHR